jgi:hypothetical protein
MIDNQANAGLQLNRTVVNVPAQTSTRTNGRGMTLFNKVYNPDL